jgi:hypothetical protein
MKSIAYEKAWQNVENDRVSSSYNENLLFWRFIFIFVFYRSILSASTVLATPSAFLAIVATVHSMEKILLVRLL